MGADVNRILMGLAGIAVILAIAVLISSNVLPRRERTTMGLWRRRTAAAPTDAREASSSRPWRTMRPSAIDATVKIGASSVPPTKRNSRSFRRTSGSRA